MPGQLLHPVVGLLCLWSMKIFVTGATGFIGYAVASELARAGHDVFGLTRSAGNSKRLAAVEVETVTGTMSDPESYAGVAKQCQVFIHCAAEYSQKYMELDRRTVEALVQSAHDSRLPRLLLYTSGCWVYGNTGRTGADESSPLNPPAMVQPRVATEALVLEANRGQVRTIIFRPGCVYGGSGSLTASWFESAETEGAARIVGDGMFRWTMVHLADLARAYRLAVESNVGGEVFNVTDRGRSTVLECAKAVSSAVNGNETVNSIPAEEAVQSMGPMVECLTLDQHVDSSKAARLLGWQPHHGGFADGVERYYRSWKAR
jgi:nucleoside-diphosphate-sugar epimerase